ncbi:MAG: proline--tRNA ligase, partial [Planctomycetes bacterium]|nr:proline--tRNA ligase [Planctomycetota bacterium]
MRWTQTLIPTLKETPEGAEAASHIFMLRGGIIGQVAAGTYAYLPLGLRALRKAERLIRGEFDAAGAVELAMPALAPLSLWDQTGRTDDFGDELIRLDLGRQGRKTHLVLAPGHDEVITDLMAQHLSSYRQLPITFYQLQSKFRNEPRPRLGLLRTREFLSHDAYSFDPSPESLDASYQAVSAAYHRIFDRLGLDYLLAEAPAGHEFVVPAEIGEQTIAHCQDCGYTANRERAEVGPLAPATPQAPPEPVRQVDTPNATTIDQVSRMLGCRPDQMIKTLIYSADSQPLAVLIRGDHEANEAKIRLATGTVELELAPPDVIERVTGAPVGFAGPVGLGEKIPVWADRDVEFMRNAVTGANRADVHLRGVDPNRDFQVAGFADLRYAVDGDPCPRCS